MCKSLVTLQAHYFVKYLGGSIQQIQYYLLASTYTGMKNSPLTGRNFQQNNAKVSASTGWPQVRLLCQN